MKATEMMKILRDNSYIRTGGSEEELRCAEYIRDYCRKLGIAVHMEEFEVDMGTIHQAALYADGMEIPCKGYMCAGSGEVEAPFYYLSDTDPYSLSQCRGKIVMIDGYLGYWKYQDLLENGAVGFISYNGNANCADRDIDQRELRSYVSRGNKIPGVNINTKDAVRLVQKGTKTAKIVLQQEEYKGVSRNVVAELPGERDEYLVLSAHYDSTPLSQGTYDNMSGSVGLLAIASHFANKPHRYGLRFVWCGCEERGLLGSKAYVAAHEDTLSEMILNINLDMIGSIMGHFLACCSTEEKMVHYIGYLGSELGFGISAYQDVYSSDSTPFADRGIPAISFARDAPENTATIHDRYDTIRVMQAEHMQNDIAFVTAFVERMANAVRCPVAREIPDAVKEKLDIYLARKRRSKQ